MSDLPPHTVELVGGPFDGQRRIGVPDDTMVIRPVHQVPGPPVQRPDGYVERVVEIQEHAYIRHADLPQFMFHVPYRRPNVVVAPIGDRHDR